MTKTAMNKARSLFAVTGVPSNSAPEAEKTQHKIHLKVRNSLVTDDWAKKASVAYALMDKTELPEIGQLPIDEIANRIMFIYQYIFEMLISGLAAEDINKLMEEYHASLITNVDNTMRLRYNAHQGNFVESVHYVPAQLASLLETAYKNKGVN